MDLHVSLIERRHADTPSIERVFAETGKSLIKRGAEVSYEKLPYGNGVIATLKNVPLFRPTDADIFHITRHIHYISLVLPATMTIPYALIKFLPKQRASSGAD